MSKKSIKLRMAFAIAKIAEVLHGRRLLKHDVTYSDFPYVRIETMPTKDMTRLGILQETDGVCYMVKIIRYCFSPKPY